MEWLLAMRILSATFLVKEIREIRLNLQKGYRRFAVFDYGVSEGSFSK
jgi:hypothetical protein